MTQIFTLFHILQWIIVLLSGMLAGHALSSEEVPAWVRWCGIGFMGCSLVALALALAELLIHQAL